MIDAPSRATLRQHWQVADDALVVAMLGDWPDAIDAVRGIIAIGLAAETGRPFHMLIHPHARGIDRATEVATAMGKVDRILMDDQALPPWPLLPGCDAALAIGPNCAASVEAARAASIPLIEDQGRPDKALSAALVAMHREKDKGQRAKGKALRPPTAT
jgi:hypothetical protein